MRKLETRLGKFQDINKLGKYIMEFPVLKQKKVPS